MPKHTRFRLFPFRSPLLRESNFFLFLQVLRCFSSLRLPHLYRWYQAFNLVGCPIRTPPDQLMFANPRQFSQLTTSFVALRSLGIRHTPFVTFSRFLFKIVVPNYFQNYRLILFLPLLSLFNTSMNEYISIVEIVIKKIGR